MPDQDRRIGSGPEPHPGAGPLAGTRVLDLTTARSGPTCTRQLADLGAEVIQVGAPHRSDIGGSDGANLRRNKRTVLLDLTTAGGRDAFLRLVETADVLVENFRPDVKFRLGIDPVTLAELNPRLVYASLSGFGQTGPYADRPGVDQIAQGLGGLMSVTGPPGTGPWRVGIAISDTVSGTFLTQGVLAALLARERTGRGQWVHTSLLEAMVNIMDFQAVRWTVDGDVPGQVGNDHPTFFPMGTFRTADGHINIAAMMRWDAFCEVIDGAALLDDERFATPASRVEHREALRAAVEELLAADTTERWVVRINAAGCPCGPVLALDEVFADPQVQHLTLTETVTDAAGATLDLLRLPLTFSDTPAAVRSGPVPRGRDTRAVLEELGYPAEAIDALIDSGAAAEGGSGEGWATR
ncbi:MAG: CoA transferase [Acidimicrobiales bacterium]|nr:CoA transferase [Acidimicrobiales bacterium]